MDEVIYDRTSESYWNPDDLNRIEQWTEELSNRLKAAGYNIHHRRGKVWTYSDDINESDMQRIRKNINDLKNGYFAIPEWRAVGSGRYHDFVYANAMEWDLQQCYNYLEAMVKIFMYTNQKNTACGLNWYLPFAAAVEIPYSYSGNELYSGDDVSF